jgi:hypothetical protein
MPWTSKPTSPVLQTGHPLHTGLVEFWPFAESSGDAVGIKESIALVPQNSADRVTTGYGLAGNCNASQKGFAVTAPSSVKINLPITIAMSFLPTATLPDSNATLFGVTANNTVTSPFIAYDISAHSSTNRRPRATFSSSGAFNATDIPGTDTYPWSGLSTTVPSTLVFAHSASERKLWLNGVEILSNTTTRGNPTYSASSTLGVGFFPGVTRSAEIQFLGGGIWSTYWGSTEVADFHDDPFELVRAAATSNGFYYRYLLGQHR